VRFLRNDLEICRCALGMRRVEAIVWLTGIYIRLAIIESGKQSYVCTLFGSASQR
jgi:hypothetical protein